MGVSLSLVEVTEQTCRVALVVASKRPGREEVEVAVRETPHEGTGGPNSWTEGPGVMS